ncbi:MAG: replication-associated recombination protein A [Candidatus Omnitrophica bacterium]|nr:replication-associated recombination protein A [Candidatus Omnitrophota bacterium]MDD5351588.1 replication-associated recombination protein A [Candidatus Omnitrophota bacterium]MDD5551023.1 replication-associated recombination protein A [Candidatus Omnitrophota bacterium]
MDLFTQEKTKITDSPLSVRMRPQTLEDFVGQRHIIGKGKLLRRAIEADRISSLILYGPPGTGKTTIAHIVANKTKAHFERINAVASGVEELRKVIEKANFRKSSTGERTIIFIDEIHRFNKAQQDVLMPGLEEGSFILIGATVHNPFFYLTSPLLSRSLVFELQPLKKEDIKEILQNSLKNQASGFGKLKIKFDDKALEFLAGSCEGDARRALNALEIGIETTKPAKDGIIHFDLEVAQESIQKKALRYDRDEDEHYDTISAFIKSMRGSDPDAALYWLAKMLSAGEDPRFIARRICICASEDVGNADPMAVVLAEAAFSVADFVGMPEARIPLAQATVYIACAPKSNAAYLGIEKAIQEIETERVQEVPKHLKDASYKGAEKLGRGKDYKYAHDYPGHFVDQKYTKRKIYFYTPQDIGYEKKIKERLNLLYNSKADAKD